MECIIKSKEFKLFAKQYDISEPAMEHALYEYQDSSGKVWNPNSQECRDFIEKKFNITSNNLVSSESEYNMLHKIWEKKGHTTYESREQALEYLKHFQDLFGEDNVTIYQNNEGKWSITAQEPLLFSEEMVSILNNATSKNSQRDKVDNKPDIETELLKLKLLNKGPIKNIGSVNKIKERLKQKEVSNLIIDIIIRAVETDPTLLNLSAVDIIALVNRTSEKDISKVYNEYLAKPVMTELEKHLKTYFNRYGITVSEQDMASFGDGVLGGYDIINKLIYVAKNRNAITLPEEYAHAFVELMGPVMSKRPENKDFTYLMNNIENTAIYKEVYEKYKDTYVTPEGVPDIFKIKKEAIGQAIAAALVNNYDNQKAPTSFWQKLKEFIERILAKFSNTEYISFDALVNQIANDIINNNYDRLEKVNSEGYNLLDYSETLATQTAKDGGKAVEFLKYFTSIGNIITGSLSYRYQGSVYRPSLDSIHDIDMTVPRTVHNIKFNQQYINEARSHNSINLFNSLEKSEYFKKIKEKYPDLTLLAAYPSKEKDQSVTVNAIWSADKSITNKFKASSGNYASRLKQFTEEERSKIYLMDFFLNDKKQTDTPIIDIENSIALAPYTDSFREKQMMGRAKDIFDYQMYRLSEQFIRPSEIRDMMFQKTPTSFQLSDMEAVPDDDASITIKQTPISTQLSKLESSSSEEDRSAALALQDEIGTTKEIKEKEEERKRQVEEEKKESENPSPEQQAAEKLSQETDDLYDSDLIDAEERKFIADHIMHQVSAIISELHNNPSTNESLFGTKYSHIDFTKIPRDEIINKIPISELLEVVKDRHFNPDYLSDGTSFKIIKKIKFINKNWNAIVSAGYSKLITLENTTLSAKPEYVNTEDVEQAFQDGLNEETKENENWQIETRSISVKASLSKGIRRMLERLYVTKKGPNGETLYVKDSYGYGFDTYVDSDLAVNSILDWCRNCESMSQIEEELSKHIDSNSWVSTILENIKKEPIRSQFFQNFRKDFTQYSIIIPVRDPKTGKVTYKVKIINTKGAAVTLMQSISNNFKLGRIPSVIITADEIEGKGRVNESNITSIRNRLNIISATLSAAFKSTKKGDFKQAIINSSPEIASILKELGIQIDASIIEESLMSSTAKYNYQETSVSRVLYNIDNIIDTLLSKEVISREDYNPFDKSDSNNLYGNYNNIINIFAKNIQDSIESSVYNDGKMYYSFVTPSYAGSLIKNLRNATGDAAAFQSFMKNEFGKYRWFKDGNTWNNSWLRLLNQSSEYREAFEHKVQLSSLGTNYRDLSEAGYAKSLILEYFYQGTDHKSKWAWYRVPILSNKPSSEFVKFFKYAGANYKQQITSELKKTFEQEILRMKTVLERLADDSVEPIKNFDLSREEFASLREKIKNKETITRGDLVKNKVLLTANSGMSFKFLEAFNNEIINDTELGNMIIDKLNGKNVESESKMKSLIEDAIKDYMDIMVEQFLDYYKSIGLYDIDEITKGNSTKLQPKQLHILSRSFEEIYRSLTNTDYKSNVVISDDLKENIKQEMIKDIDSNLTNYIWNDVLATINIIQLTATDLAYYKNIEDFQKRFAQIHSPGLQLNTEATDAKGVKYSSDGMSRTIYLKDEKIVSEIIPNIEEIFDRKIKEASESQKESIRAIKSYVISQYKKVNATDAQAYNSPTSVRKKLGMQGKWGENEEAAYKKIKEGNWDVNDLNILLQPIKPFVYSQITKYGSTTMQNIKVGLQNKNSEYLIFLADAITRPGKNPNKLRAIMDFMEESAYDIDDNSNKVYNGQGIDTVQFQSAVKVGEQGVIDITKATTYEETKRLLEEAAYIDPKKKSSTTNINRFNENSVHTYQFSDYRVQQEVPAHMQDHYQAWGSQVRVLIVNDLQDKEIYSNGMTGQAIRDKFFELSSKNIELSIKELQKELNLTGTQKQKNRALERILQNTILSDVKYGEDLARACRLNKDGEFNIPLNDPIQSMRIQQLLNSIIKNRLYKQKIAGGPTVQVTSFGLSNDLNIVFKEDGSLSHYESYCTCPSSELEEALTREDSEGNKYLITPEQAIKEGIITEDALKLIGYRIPTEMYYSIMPIKIKGFLPRTAGEAVMLPKEITTITGSDYDIDKIYIMAKELDPKDFSLESEDERSVTNNELFDLSWSVLTSKQTADKMFNPGSFDVQKKISKIVQILNNPNIKLEDKNYNELIKKSDKELDKLIQNTTSHNIILPTSQVYFHKQNMTAGKLIGIFANHNVSHSIINPLDIKLNLTENTQFTFDGHRVSKDMNNALDGLQDKNGQYISKNIAGFLAASVDAVKDPVLNFLNLNTATTGVAMLLTRLGFDVDSVGLFLTQPLIKKVVDKYFIKNDSGYTSLDDVINEELSKYSNNLINGYKKSLINTNFTKEELAGGIATNGINNDFQIRSLLLFQRLYSMTSQLGDITFLTKFNSSNNGPNNTIANTLTQDMRIDKMYNTAHDSPNSIFRAEDLDKVMENPIIKSFYDGARDLSYDIFSEHFVQYNSIFQRALTRLNESVKMSLDEDTINKLANDFVLYIMTYGDNPLLSGKYESRERFAYKFVKEFENKAKDLKDNELIKIIKTNPSDYLCPVSTLSANTSGYSINSQEKIKNAWEKLIKNPETKELASDIFLYNMQRTGLSFSPKTFLHLASVSTKKAMDGYIQTLRDINNISDIGVDNFINQFKRNHSNNFRVVPLFTPGTGVQVNQSSDTVEFKFTDKNQVSPIVIREGQDKIQFVNIIRYGDKLYELSNSSKTTVRYKEISRLGVTNNFLEYDANDANIKTVFNSRPSDETEIPVTPPNPAKEISEEQFLKWVDSSVILEEVAEQVFSKDDLDLFADNMNKTTLDKLIDNYLKDHTLSTESRNLLYKLREEENNLTC